MTRMHAPAREAWLQKWFIRLLVPALLINAGALMISILEPDGALYATIAKTIARSGDFINLRVEGKDWLDKPHFPFWMAALSMRVFGINHFAYKLPALLFWAAGAWYTYRLAASLYGRHIGQLSTLIYVSAAHLVISNNDVRAEPYLTGLVIGSVFHLYKAARPLPGADGSAGPAGPEGSSVAPPDSPWFGHLLAGSLLAACAAMTKGPFVLITIAAGFVLDWMVKGQWRQFREVRWWMAILLTGLFITPELYCLYVQFDLHPEKLIFGHTGVSGIRFFFWDSQFGRFFNTGPIRGNGDPFFYFHTILWAFLPWSLLLYAAVVQKCRRLGRTALSTGTTVPGDLICLGGALVSFAIFSLSRFQLPHYLNLLFPFFAILTAEWLYGIRRRKTKQIVAVLQNLVNVLLPLLVVLLSWFFHFRGWPFIMAGMGILAFFAFRVFRGGEPEAITGRSYWIALTVYAVINFSFYPAMLHYQAGTEAGNYIGSLRGIDQLRDRDSAKGPEGAPVTVPAVTAAGTPASAPPDRPVYMLRGAPANYSFQFYCPRPVEIVPMDSLRMLAGHGPLLIFLPDRYVDSLSGKGCRVEVLRHFANFHISQLTAGFINYRTRSHNLDGEAVVRVW